MSQLKVADYPRSAYEVYWEMVPNSDHTVVRLYAYDTGELVEEREVLGGKEAACSFIVSRMTAYQR